MSDHPFSVDEMRQVLRARGYVVVSIIPTESMVQVASGNPTGFWARCFYTQWFRVLRVVDPHANGKIDAAEAALKAKLRSKHA